MFANRSGIPDNKKGGAKGAAILIIVLLIAIAIVSMYIRLNWQRFKAEASFGFTMAALIVFLIAIIVIVIRINLRKARKEKERKAREEAERLEQERLERARLERERLERVEAGLEEPVEEGYLGDGKFELSDIGEAASMIGDKISGMLSKKDE